LFGDAQVVRDDGGCNVYAWLEAHPQVWELDDGERTKVEDAALAVARLGGRIALLFGEEPKPYIHHVTGGLLIDEFVADTDLGSC